MHSTSLVLKEIDGLMDGEDLEGMFGGLLERVLFYLYSVWETHQTHRRRCRVGTGYGSVGSQRSELKT